MLLTLQSRARSWFPTGRTEPGFHRKIFAAEGAEDHPTQPSFYGMLKNALETDILACRLGDP